MSCKRISWLILLILICGTAWGGYRTVHQSALNHDLIMAAGADDLSNVRMLLSRGADPNASEDETPGKGWHHLLNVLLRHKQHVALTNPLSQAMPDPFHALPPEINQANPRNINQIEIVRLLLEHGANTNVQLPGQTPLPFRSCLGPHADRLIPLFLQHGADPNTVDDEGDCMLTYVLASHEEALVKMVLNYGAKPDLENITGETALMWAACGHDSKAIKCLLACGADINHKNKNGNSALTYAVMAVTMEDGMRPSENAKRQNAIDVLLAAGADVNLRDHQGGSPFLFALSQTKDTVTIPIQSGIIDERPRINVTSMLAHGADVHRAIPVSASGLIVSWDHGRSFQVCDAVPGTTPLMFATASQGVEVVHKMLALGADVNACDAKGKTALDYVQETRPCSWEKGKRIFKDTKRCMEIRALLLRTRSRTIN
jgi:ankyrin repeat protein